MKHQIVMLHDELTTDPLLSQIILILREWALSKKMDPSRPLDVTFKSRIFPLDAKTE